jgi:holo-[acyl-carrier protein] synthase
VITGVGLDLFDVARIERDTSRHGPGLLHELLTPAELDDCRAMRRPAQGHAERFAAKEACFKALGTGKIGGMRWEDIEIYTAGHGCHTVTLAGETAGEAAAQGVNRVLLSLSSTPVRAVAWVVMHDDGPPGIAPSGRSG